MYETVFVSFAPSVKEYERLPEETKEKLINDKDFVGDIYLNNIKKVSTPFILEKGLRIQDDNYKWLEFYDYNSKVRLLSCDINP